MSLPYKSSTYTLHSALNFEKYLCKKCAYEMLHIRGFAKVFTLANASNFAIFLEYENPHTFFCFSFHATFIFFPLIYVDMASWHPLGKKDSSSTKWKVKKTMCGFSYCKNIANYYFWGLRSEFSVQKFKKKTLILSFQHMMILWFH